MTSEVTQVDLVPEPMFGTTLLGATAAEVASVGDVHGVWRSTWQYVSGSGVAQGKPFLSEAHSGTGVRMTVGADSVEIDFRDAKKEVHALVGQRVNSWIQFRGSIRCNATVTGAITGAITMDTATATGDATAENVFLGPRKPVGWGLAESLRLGGPDGNVMGLIPVKATFICAGSALVVYGEGGGTNQDGQGGHWQIRSTVVYERAGQSRR
ncbi:hypothetical protein [Saccharopolyspora phatthalungensis]|uniref:Uncharacterized protein n=1 Tax=Saccharopolyspora phatthalungensis TaxID=664693 RepID=A0A840QKA6_9PSEU|nr:hypothetical protein [Saccharopolyspora phatthalungensis]MBB5158723.1 hypothetical protein [Saccharopolyspora phatthalungensis]